MDNSKILIIDDESINNKLITGMLASFGIESESTTAASKIFKMIKKSRPDLILLDLLMPNQDGFATLNLLSKSEYDDIPVIILSAENSDEALSICLEAGAVDYLIKPVRRLELKARIQSALRFSRLKTKLSKNLEELKNINEHMERELEIAKKIQISSVGNPDFENDYLTISSRLEIANRLGGDFYDIRIGDENIVLATIADVAGHGVSSALIAMMLKALLDSHATGFWTPAELLDILQENFFGRIPRGYYIALSHLIYKPATDTLTYAVAGLYDIIIIRKDSSQLEFAGSRNFAVGFIASTTFTEKSIPIFSGDKIVLYTDGINEARNEAGEMYSRERFHRLLSRNSHLSAPDLRTKFFQERDQFIGKRVLEDDTTLMIMEIK